MSSIDKVGTYANIWHVKFSRDFRTTGVYRDQGKALDGSFRSPETKRTTGYSFYLELSIKDATIVMHPSAPKRIP